MENIQRTVYSSYIQTCMALQLPMTYTPFSTLNEKFNVALNKTIDPTKYPKISYAVIGNGGHKIEVDSSGFYLPVPAQHMSTDAALFNHLPFVLRLANNDLTQSEMSRYRLRVPVIYNNQQYIAYYAKVLDQTNTEPTLVQKTINNSNTVITPFIATVNNLSPTPVDLSVTAPNLVNNNYVGTAALADLIFTADDVKELLDAANIIYGNPNKAIISEIGICSGIDIDLQTVVSGKTISFTEAVGVQINTFSNTFYPMSFINLGFSLTYNVGATEPLLDLTT